MSVVVVYFSFLLHHPPSKLLNRWPLQLPHAPVLALQVNNLSVLTVGYQAILRKAALKSILSFAKLIRGRREKDNLLPEQWLKRLLAPASVPDIIQLQTQFLTTMDQIQS